MQARDVRGQKMSKNANVIYESSLHKKISDIQGRNHRYNLSATVQMVGSWNRVKVSQNIYLEQAARERV